MRPITALFLAFAVAGAAGSAGAFERSNDCYAYLTMRQVQTGDYSYTVLQNCEIVPRTPAYSPGPMHVRPAYVPQRVPRVRPRRAVAKHASRPAHRRAGRKFRRR